ncbi:hypothetical protein MO973_04665 [Paenibacillus sp. TRM 82003]|nr:hypothetical protein [Paenibacillus sp. TRM 82003]
MYAYVAAEATLQAAEHPFYPFLRNSYGFVELFLNSRGYTEVIKERRGLKVSAFQKRLGLLRAYEQTTFSLCIHLLANESEAVRAAKAALVDLFANDAFAAAGTDEERTRLVRSAATRRCLQLHQTRKRDVR